MLKLLTLLTLLTLLSLLSLLTYIFLLKHPSNMTLRLSGLSSKKWECMDCREDEMRSQLADNFKPFFQLIGLMSNEG